MEKGGISGRDPQDPNLLAQTLLCNPASHQPSLPSFPVNLFKMLSLFTLSTLPMLFNPPGF